MYEDAHLEAYYESRQHGDLDHDSFEDDWDLEDEDEEDYWQDQRHMSYQPYCEIHKAEHDPGGFLCELKASETWGGTE